MPELVANGALLRCSMGTVPSPLNIVPGQSVTINHQAAATIYDMVSMVNIPTFGLCRSPSNPTVASATAAALGVLTPMPCVPATTSPWNPGAPTVTIQGRTLLSNSGTCMCSWGGTVSIEHSGTIQKSTG
jgi:hypothetical protein